MVESNTTVLMLLASEGVDPSNFPDPYSFRPERFINAEGKFETNENFDIFSRGKRKCPGYEIANMSSAIYCAKVLQHFNVSPESPDSQIPYCTRSLASGILSVALRFQLREGAPAIQRPPLETGLTALIREVVDEELADAKSSAKHLSAAA